MSNWLSVIVAAVAFVLLLAGLVPFLRAKNTSATISLLRSELAVETDAREAQERRCVDALTEQDKRHTQELAELRGRVETLTTNFAHTIGKLVVAAVREQGQTRD